MDSALPGDSGQLQPGWLLQLGKGAAGHTSPQGRAAGESLTPREEQQLELLPRACPAQPSCRLSRAQASRGHLQGMLSSTGKTTEATLGGEPSEQQNLLSYLRRHRLAQLVPLEL